MVQVRTATHADLGAIVDIYNASILTTTTWSDRPQTLGEREAWFAARSVNGDAVYIAHDERGAVVGFAAYGDFRDNSLWPGYRFTVENTVHVRDGHHGQGTGRMLMRAVIAHVCAAGKHVMIAAVASDNAGSIAFHESLGYVQTGNLREIGRKFDRWLDLVLLQLILD